MGLNPQSDVDARFSEKWVSVKKLKEILSILDDELELYPNSVGNLSVINPKIDRQIGYIDLAFETYEKFE